MYQCTSVVIEAVRHLSQNRSPAIRITLVSDAQASNVSATGPPAARDASDVCQGVNRKARQCDKS